MMGSWWHEIKNRAVPILMTVIVVLLGVIAWLLFSPGEQDSEWRNVNREMEQTLAQFPTENKSTDSAKTTDSAKSEISDNASTSTTSSLEKSDTAEVGFPINLNTATVDQLDALPGIGPSKAQAIIDLRNQLGTFSSTEQLLDVKGIGEKTYAKLRDKVTIGP